MVRRILTNSVVLIETYWNVKKDILIYVETEDDGINRNILECKVKAVVSITIDDEVLIETYWNVKAYRLSTVSIIFSCINRNILECKD